MAKRDDITTFNVRFPKKLFTQLKQHQVNETTRRNQTVSLHALILEAVKTMAER
jgi:hypothetical protein